MSVSRLISDMLRLSCGKTFFKIQKFMALVLLIRILLVGGDIYRARLDEPVSVHVSARKASKPVVATLFSKFTLVLGEYNTPRQSHSGSPIMNGT